MPLFEFRCTYCGHRFEEITKFDAAAPTCPAIEIGLGAALLGAEADPCGHPTERQISKPGRAQFVGSGCYENDYKRAGK